MILAVSRYLTTLLFSTMAFMLLTQISLMFSTVLDASVSAFFTASSQLTSDSAMTSMTFAMDDIEISRLVG